MYFKIKKYFNKIVNFRKKKLFKKTSLLFIANLAINGIGFLITVLMTRTLTVYEFGLISTTISLFEFICLNLTDLGFNMSFVKYYSFFKNKSLSKISFLLKHAFIRRLIFSIMYTVIFYFLYSVIAERTFNNSDLSHLFYISMFGIFGFSIYDFIKSPYAQAKENFRLMAILPTINKIVLLALFFVIYLMDYLNPENYVLIYWIPSYIIIIAVFFTDTWKKIFNSFKVKNTSIKDKKELVTSFVKYTKWTFIIFITLSLVNKIDIFLLQAFRNSTEVGYYNGAFKFVSAIVVAFKALEKVLFPFVSRLETSSSIKNYLRNLAFITPIVLIVTVAIAFLGAYFIPIIFSSKYTNSIVPFKIMVFAWIPAIFFQLFFLVFHSINKPHVITIINLITLIILFIADLILIPTLGVLGVAWSNVIAHATSSVVGLIILFYYYNKKIKVGDF